MRKLQALHSAGVRAGNLGEQRYLQLNPFQQTAKVTDGLVSGSADVTSSLFGKVQELARGIASKLFD